MTIGTKSYWTNEMNQITHGDYAKDDITLGYNIPIPWNDVTTFGWKDSVLPFADGHVMWGQENVVSTRADPEWWAPDGILRSNVIPTVDPNNPIFQFDRSQYTKRFTL